MEEKYGVSNAAHIPEIAESICSNRYKKRHEYQLENGDTIYLQGYEPYGFDYLKLITDESEIRYRKKDMPVIWYEWEGRKRRYYPDFYLQESNMVVEIKSLYTYTKDFEQIKLKIRETNNTGYNLLLLIFEKNGELLLKEEHICHPGNQE